MRTKICKTCGKEFMQNSNSQKHCRSCRIVLKKERRRKWRIKNKEYLKLYGQTHRKHLTELRKKQYEREPWLRNLRYIWSRCSSKSHWYYKKGIKNFLTKDNIKTLWFRDKAYLMKKPSIDRINGKDNYTFNNCRFLEFVENCSRKT